jgi:hypothetical protein
MEWEIISFLYQLYFLTLRKSLVTAVLVPVIPIIYDSEVMKGRTGDVGKNMKDGRGQMWKYTTATYVKALA